MKNHIKIEMTIDTYDQRDPDAAPKAMLAALRSTLRMFERNGIYNEGSAETEDGVRITWTASRDETRQ